jgi:hypothetical protein
MTLLLLAGSLLPRLPFCGKNFGNLAGITYRLRTRHLHCKFETMMKTAPRRYAFLAKVIRRSFEMSEWMVTAQNALFAGSDGSADRWAIVPSQDCQTTRRSRLE